RETAVVAQGEGTDVRLVAYVVLKAGAALEPEFLRQAALHVLPEAMVPAAFVALPALPVTPNGKLDREALPKPEPAGPRRPPEPARDDVERRLVAIWERHLDARPIGIHDRFFEIGGHSLLAVRIFRAIEAEFGRELPLATVFQAGTVAELAALLS